MFHINLKNRRLISGLTQKQVATLLQISPQSISKWEKGEAKPSIDYLPALAECLDCEINDFFCTIQTEQEKVSLLNTYLKLQVGVICHGGTTINDVSIFVSENPSILDIYLQFITKIRQSGIINLQTIQNLLSCSHEEAQNCLDYLIHFEMVESIKETENYLLIPNLGDGQQLLKLFKDYGNHLTAKQLRVSKTP